MAEQVDERVEAEKASDLVHVFIAKATEDTSPGGDKDPRRVQESNAKAEEDRAFVSVGAIEPPYDPRSLVRLFEHSNSLRQNVDAYGANIEAFGHRYEPVIEMDAVDARERVADALYQLASYKAGPGKEPKEPADAEIDAATAQMTKEMRRERAMLDTFFEFCSDDTSFVTLRRRTRQDLEVTGNAYWEVLRNGFGRIARFSYLPSFTMRLLPLDAAISCDQTVRASALHYEKIPARRRFRKFVQVWNGVTTWFKEFGDPRIVGAHTGTVYADEAALKAAEDVKATEVVHLKVYSSVSPYGVPRWVGVLLNVLGARYAEEVNLMYFDNKAVPPLAVVVSGGRVTKDAVARIQSFVNEQVKGRKNFHSILIVDAEVAGGADFANSGRMKIQLQPLTAAQHNDALFQNYDERCMDKVGMAFRMPRMLRGDVRDFNRACYSEDTETLTERGWKRWIEIAPDERIAAFSPEHGEIAFVVPDALHVYDVVDEEMWRFANQHTDCLVTGDHKMLVRSEQTSAARAPWETHEAGKVPYNRFAVRLAADEWRGSDAPAEFLLPKEEKCRVERGHDHEQGVRFDDWLEFLGYWISEGGLLQTEHPAAPYLVYLDQKNPEVLPKMRACLDRLGWVFSEQTKSDGTVHFLFSNRCLRSWLIENCGTHAQDKRIPWEYLGLASSHLRTLFDALEAGDGTVDGRENRTSGCYYSSSTVLAGQVQRLLIQLGRRSEVIPGDRCWRVMHSEHKTTRLNAVGQDRTPPSVTREKYTGAVYCFSVPGFGFFVTRRNGKVAIHGNTAEAALSFAETQVFTPEREDFDFFVNRHFMPDLGIRYWRFRSNAPTLRDPTALSQAVALLSQAGVLTPEEARQISEGVFNREFKRLTAEWTQQPITLTLAGIQNAAGDFLGPGGDGEPGPEEDAASEPGKPAPPGSPGLPPPRPIHPGLQPAPKRIAGLLPGARLRKNALQILALRDELLHVERATAAREFYEGKRAPGR